MQLQVDLLWDFWELCR